MRNHAQHLCRRINSRNRGLVRSAFFFFPFLAMLFVMLLFGAQIVSLPGELPSFKAPARRGAPGPYLAVLVAGLVGAQLSKKSEASDTE
jgi:hypothetical protein